MMAGLSSLQVYERWSKHDDLTKYVAVLEEWDDIVGEDWNQPESNFLNPVEQLEGGLLKDFSDKLNYLFETAFSKVDIFIKSHF